MPPKVLLRQLHGDEHLSNGEPRAGRPRSVGAGAPRARGGGGERRAPRPAPRFPPGAAASAAPPIYGEISRGKMASPEPEDSWSNHIHTHTHARTHTHSHTGARRARLILAGARKKKNYVYPPSLRSMLYIFFSFLQRMDWSFKKCCRVRARRRRCAEGEGAFAELCSSVRGAGRPCPPARSSARGR